LNKHITPKCLAIIRLKRKHTSLFKEFTKKQAAELQEIINEAFGICEIHKKQVL
ncbi:27654_t:CDS:1, partial [Dentiscutata erythropus]